MRTNRPKSAQLGDLVAAVFDEAAGYSADPREVSNLAVRAVCGLLRRTRQTSRLSHQFRPAPGRAAWFAGCGF